MRKELLNTQIENLSVEHGAQIVEFYKSHGFDTGESKGSILGHFYGVKEDGYFCAYPTETNRKTITLEQAKQLVYPKDFSKMDLEEWIEETEKLGLSLEELDKHIERNKTCSCDNIYYKLEGNGCYKKAKILFEKWNTPNLYTEITAYKLADGTIVETKEDAENKAKDLKIKKDLLELFVDEKALFIYQNLEIIKKIINQ